MVASSKSTSTWPSLARFPVCWLIVSLSLSFRVNAAPIEETLSRFKSSYARLCTARQERQLAEVSGDVDKDRLTTDEVYGYVRSHPMTTMGPLTRALSITAFRKEVLLGLGRTSKKAALTVAFTLARRYTFPEYLVRPLLLSCTRRVAYTSNHACIVHQVALESLEHTLRNPEASDQSFTDLATFLAPRLQNADADVPHRPCPPDPAALSDHTYPRARRW